MDKEFSPLLRALMAEWVTFFSICRFYEVYGDDFAEVRHPSAEAYFNNSFFVAGPSGPFDYHHYVIEEMKVIKTSPKNNHHYVANCDYRRIWSTIFSNINTKSHSPVSHFLQAATDWGSPLTPSENVAFTIDEGCRTLFKQFQKEEFVRSENSNFYWTKKVRAIFEYSRVWASHDQVKEALANPWQEEIISTFSAYDKKCIEICADRGDIVSAVMYIKTISFKGRTINLMNAKPLAEYMYPSIWGKPEKEFHWKWYAEIPSKFVPQT